MAQQTNSLYLDIIYDKKINARTTIPIPTEEQKRIFMYATIDRVDIGYRMHLHEKAAFVTFQQPEEPRRNGSVALALSALDELLQSMGLTMPEPTNNNSVLAEFLTKQLQGQRIKAYLADPESCKIFYAIGKSTF